MISTMDILAEFEILSSKKDPFSNKSFSAARVTLRMKTYDVSTGRLISNVQSNSIQVSQSRMSEGRERMATWRL